MTTQPSTSRFPWLAVIIAAALACAGVGLLAFAVWNVVSVARPPTAPIAAPPTAQPATQVIAKSEATAVGIPTITQAPPEAPTQAPPTASTQAVGATGQPASPSAATEPATALPPTAPPTADLNLKILQPANVRSGPGLNYPVIGGIQAGTSLPVDGRDSSGQWYAVKYGAVEGWISGVVSSYGGDVGALPVIAAPPTPIPTKVPPTATPAPTAVPVPTNPPAPVGYSSRGIVGVSFGVAYAYANVNDQVWFGFTVTNSSNTTVEYSALAAHTDVGYTAWSWTMQKLKPGETLEWRDNIRFDKPGTYQLYLGICYAGSVEACKTATWDRLSPNVTVTISE